MESHPATREFTCYHHNLEMGSVVEKLLNLYKEETNLMSKLEHLSLNRDASSHWLNDEVFKLGNLKFKMEVPCDFVFPPFRTCNIALFIFRIHILLSTKDLCNKTNKQRTNKS